jgi:hypothetical protein
MSEIPTTDLDSAHQALDHMLVSVREHAWPNANDVWTITSPYWLG